MTDEHEQRLQFLIAAYRNRYGEMHFDYDKVEERLYELIGDIEDYASDQGAEAERQAQQTATD